MIVYGEEEQGPVDVLAVGAHPDDVEIAMGGTLALLSARGHRIGLVDLTRGETGSRGTPEQRLAESKAAAGVLGAAFRFNMLQPDGELEYTREGKLDLIQIIRRYRPAMVFSHNNRDPHPDHAAAHVLVKSAVHNAGLGKILPEMDPFRPVYFFTFSQPHRVTPSFLVDISEYYPVKMQAISCHQSQVSPLKPEDPETYLGQSFFFEVLQSHMRSFGAMVGATYAEAFHSDSLLVVDDPLQAFRKKQGRLL